MKKAIQSLKREFLLLRGLYPLTDIAALTDSKGRFVITAPTPGEYTIEVVSEGFDPCRVKISTGDSGESRIEIRLSRGGS